MQYQLGLSGHARSEKLRALAWQSGVFVVVGVWGYFSFSPARFDLFGLRGWASVAVWSLLALFNAVVTLNRCYAVAWVDDEGMELRSFFTHRHIPWVHVSGIVVERRRFDQLLVLRVYRTVGYPIDIPGAIARGDGGVAHADLVDKAEVLSQHWHRVVESATQPGEDAGRATP